MAVPYLKNKKSFEFFFDIFKALSWSILLKNNVKQEEKNLAKIKVDEMDTN